jgi:hypothetical protein
MMAEWHNGRRFSSREEDGLPPLSQEELDRAEAMFAEFDQQRQAVPPDKRIHLSSRFGDDDFDDDPDNRNPDGTRKQGNDRQDPQ